MRRSIEELRTFYGEPAGALARRLLARRLEDAWGEAANCDVLGVGYTTPWLDAFVGARRVVAAMPGGQGVEPWPSVGKNRTLLVDDRRLPFAAGSFDRILLIHALEEADDAQGLMNEAVRALSPAGRIILVAAARGGLWARAEATPFGHGRPFTRRQLERLVRGAGLEPTAWSQTLYVPPWGPLLPLADGFEQIGKRIMPGAAGVILLEATRQAYARIRPGGAVATVPVLTPAMRPSRPHVRRAICPTVIWRDAANALKALPMQRLILMRHAEAERAAGSGRDRDRVLSARGRADAAAMGRALSGRGMRPDLALVSPAARTRQTWDLLHDAFGDVQVREDEPLYNGGAGILRRFVEAGEDEAGCLMVVAHNPGVHLLAVEYLVESAASPAVLDRMSGGFPPGAAAIFTVDVAGRCTFEGFIQPRDLAGA